MQRSRRRSGCMNSPDRSNESKLQVHDVTPIQHDKNPSNEMSAKRKHKPTGSTPVHEKKRYDPRRSTRLIDITNDGGDGKGSRSPEVTLITSGSDDSDESISPKAKRTVTTPKQSKRISIDSKRESTKSNRINSIELDYNETIKILTKAFAEVEKDDRAMYRVTDDVIREEISSCEKSDLVETTTSSELRRMCTYGEVLPDDISRVVIPLLAPDAHDIFYDLGCGTGKIVLQFALQTKCQVAKGVELMLNRILEGQRALDRATTLVPDIIAQKTIRIVQGDICYPPDEANLEDATIVFINNVVFPPQLMVRVLDILCRMKHLKRVVSMRKLCERHRDERCKRNESGCSQFRHPPQEERVLVSWAKDASCYLYERI